MSYARWSEGDVYAFCSVHGGYTCMNCMLEPERDEPEIDLHKDFWCDTPKELLEHLRKHREAGHEVPQRAFNTLEKEVDNE